MFKSHRHFCSSPSYSLTKALCCVCVTYQQFEGFFGSTECTRSGKYFRNTDSVPFYPTIQHWVLDPLAPTAFARNQKVSINIYVLYRFVVPFAVGPAGCLLVVAFIRLSLHPVYNGTAHWLRTNRRAISGIRSIHPTDVDVLDKELFRKVLLWYGCGECIKFTKYCISAKSQIHHQRQLIFCPGSYPSHRIKKTPPKKRNAYIIAWIIHTTGIRI